MKHLFYAFFVITLTSCYVSKPLEQEVKVRVTSSFPVSVNNTGNSSFSGKFTEQDYQAKFMEGLKAEFGTSKLIVDNDYPDFEIQITGVEISESTAPHTVNDTTSTDHGRQYELTTLNLKANGTIKQISTGKQSSWSADKSKAEKVTSLRSATQIAKGLNKDSNEYREKTLEDDQAATLTRQCGRRAGVSIAKEIGRAL